MKNNITELVFILDRSGSMSGLERDTIGGFNSMIDRQRTGEGQVNVTTVLFDDRFEVLHDREDIRSIRPMTADEYYVRGCTALFDAVGLSISRIKTALHGLPEQKRADRVMFVITTDGYENASREYGGAKVRQMVENCKKKGWEFLFLGANIDAADTAKGFGIDADHAADYHADAEGTALNFEVLSDAISMARSCAAPLGAGWKKRIDSDFKNRKPGR